MSAGLPRLQRTHGLDTHEDVQHLRALGLDVHVDHYYPLQGKTVSGPHVHQNLRIVLAEDNLRKRNKHPDEAA